MPTSPDPQPTPSFKDLLESARQGDSPSINAIFERFYPRVERMVHVSLNMDLRHGRPWLSSRFSTGDVVQDVFRSVVGDLSLFEGSTEDAFTGYLAMVVRNRILDSLRFHEAERRDGRRGAPELELERQVGEEGDPAQMAANADELRRMYELVGEFDPREQFLLRARFEGTASFAELTDMLGYPSVTTTRRAYFNAHALLAVRLGIPVNEDLEQ